MILLILKSDCWLKWVVDYFRSKLGFLDHISPINEFVLSYFKLIYNDFLPNVNFPNK